MAKVCWQICYLVCNVVHPSLSEHILETCEDDTKSMFSLVQVRQLGSNIACLELLGKGGGRRGVASV